MHKISRRALLAGAGLAACGGRRTSGFPGHVFVANQDGRSVAVVDLTTFALERQIAVEGAPSALLAHPERRAVYVLSPEAVHEIDAARPALRRTTRLGASAVSMRFAPDRNSLWVLCREPHCLARVALDGLRPVHHVRLPSAGEDFDVSRDGLLAVVFPREGRAGLAAPQAASIERMTPAGPDPWTVRFQRDGRQLLAGSRGGRVLTILNVAASRVTAHLPLPLEPARFCFNADGGQLFVSGPGMDAVVIVYPYQTEIAETVLAGKRPGAMTCSTLPPYLFVANPSTATVTVLDVDTRKLVCVIGVGQEPGQILLTPDGQYAMVLNRRSGDLAVVRVPALRLDSEGKPRRYTAPPLFNLIAVGAGPVSAAVVVS